MSKIQEWLDTPLGIDDFGWMMAITFLAAGGTAVLTIILWLSLGWLG